MQALVFEGRDQVAVRSVVEPAITAATDAVVDVIVAGICGTDTHAVHAPPPGLSPGTVLGHEFVGRVSEVGSAVNTMRPGDVMVGSDFAACGRCWWCRQREHWQCPERRFFGTGSAFGLPQAGALAEAVLVPFADTTLAHLPANVIARDAVFATDTLATAVSACERGDVRPGDIVAVVGAGPVGQLAAMTAHVFGASAVVVSDPVEARREAVERSGAVSATPTDLADYGMELTDGRGYDVVIEAVGSTTALEAAAEVVRGRGTVVSVGVPGSPRWDVSAQEAFRRELTLCFAVGDPIRERDRVLTMLATKQIELAPVIGEEVLLRDVVGWFHSFSRGEAMKVLVDATG